MKRFHVHVHVQDIPQSIAFYSKMFAEGPTRVEPDYAKWMLDDPRVNFAISTRGGAPGVGHLGLQTDDGDELAELEARAWAADLSLLVEGTTTCCYANSQKHRGDRPARRRLGALPHAARHPRVQRARAESRDRVRCPRRMLRRSLRERPAGHACHELLHMTFGTAAPGQLAAAQA